MILMLAVLFTAVCSHQDDLSVLDGRQGYICEAQGRTVYAAWGEAGLSKSCIGPDGKVSGTTMIAEWGHIFAVENFDSGRRHRVLEIYDKDGRIYKREIDGVPVPPERCPIA